MYPLSSHTLTLIVVALGLLSLSMAGCDGLFYDLDDVPAADNSDDHDDHDDVDDAGHDANADASNDDSQNDDLPASVEETAERIREVFELVGATRAEVVPILCECAYDEPVAGDFDSEQDCLDELELSENEQTYWAICIENSVLEYDQVAPENTDIYLSCVEEAHTKMQDCIDDVDTDNGDICSEEIYEEFQFCFFIFDNQDIQKCEEQIDEDVEAWRDGVADIASSSGCPLGVD